MSDTKALEVARIADGLRTAAMALHHESRRLSAFAIKYGRLAEVLTSEELDKVKALMGDGQ